MANFMGDYVSLPEFARRAPAVGEFVEEPEVEVDLLVRGAIEWARGGLGGAAPGCRVVAKEDKFRMTVWNASLRQQAVPCLLSIVEHEGDELNLGLLAG